MEVKPGTMNIRRKNHVHSSEKPRKQKSHREKSQKLARVAREEARPKQPPSQKPGINFISGSCESSSCGEEAACVQHNATVHYCVCTSNAEPPKDGATCPRSTAVLGRGKISRPPTTCGPSSCGEEAACIQHNATVHYCVCTSNGKPPKDGATCPRSTVPLTPKAIHNVRPPQTSNGSAFTRNPLLPTAQVPKSLVRSEIYAEATAGTDTASVGSIAGENAQILISIALLGSVFLLVLISIAIFYIKRRISVVDGKVKPRIRPGEPLLAERYITNPQYGVCGAGTVAPSAVGPAEHNADPNEPQVTLLDRNALTFLEEVGEGCFGKVYKGVLRNTTGEQVVAIKVLKESAGRSAEEDFVREVSIMSAFRHPNILALIGVVYRDDINASPWMVFEYMEWGDLAGVLRGSRGGGKPGPTLDEPALLRVAVQVARGMQYLASRHFVHRDLAARNCLVGGQLAVKIADFGMSRDVYTCDYYKMGGERPMPVRWMPPESIVYARFTHESDVWSYGVVLWEIYSRGKQPFYGCNNDGATKRILQGILLVPPEDCPRFACELMRACWATDPRDRIGFDEICRKLEAAEAADPPMQTRLPRPPPPPQDSKGYLIPKITPCVDYMKPIPDPDPDSDFSDDDIEEEYT